MFANFTTAAATSKSSGITLTGGAIAIAAGKGKQRRVVATDQSIYVLEGDFWGTTKSKGLVARHPIGSVAVERGGRSLRIGDERIWIHPFAEGDANEIAALVPA